MVEDEMVEDGKENYNGDLAGGLYTPKLRDSPPENQKIEDRVSANDRVIAHPRSSSNNYYVHNVFSFDLQANVGGLRVRSRGELCPILLNLQFVSTHLRDLCANSVLLCNIDCYMQNNGNEYIRASY